MTNRRRNIAIIAAGAAVAAVGFGGVMSASADTGSSTNGDATVNQSAQGDEQEVSDGPNEGPDAIPNEPGHQDASDAGDESDSAESDGETSDGPNQGPDANPNEPGHQDASDAGDGNE